MRRLRRRKIHHHLQLKNYRCRKPLGILLTLTLLTLTKKLCKEGRPHDESLRAFAA